MNRVDGEAVSLRCATNAGDRHATRRMPRRSIASLRYINQEALTGSLCWLDREDEQEQRREENDR